MEPLQECNRKQLHDGISELYLVPLRVDREYRPPWVHSACSRDPLRTGRNGADSPGKRG